MTSLIHRLIILSVLPLIALDSAGAQENDALTAVLDQQPEKVQQRFAHRHPYETLTFFEVQPGMTVVEALPGGGWYSKILMAYLGPQGRLIGVDYAPEMFKLFGFFSEEQLLAKQTWVDTWTTQAREWGIENSARVDAFQMGALPEPMQGTADRVLFIRAMHNLARFEDQGGYLATAISDAWAVLKPGGMVGVVQHMAPDGASDEWASGSRGYLKMSHVIEQFEAAGFMLSGISDINFNAEDVPGESDSVWRLPPTMATSRENPELREQMEAIGESNRMTLKFTKPG